jgi:hypothetical protein
VAIRTLLANPPLVVRAARPDRAVSGDTASAEVLSGGKPAQFRFRFVREADAMVIDVAVMAGDWRQEVRAEVIERVLAAMAAACEVDEPSPAWWVNFRVIDEGSWGSSGGVLSILTLLESGVFTPEKAAAIRAALSGAAAPVR